MPEIARSIALVALLASLARPASAETAAFRLTALELRDPHVFVSSFACVDVTDFSGLGGPSFNDVLQDALAGDADGDGFIDLGWVVVFDSLDTTPGASGMLRFGAAKCVAPGGTECAPAAIAPLAPLAFTNSAAGTCLAPLPGTTWEPYDPDVTIASHPCFVTDSADLTLDLMGLLLPLSDARIAALYFGSPLQLQTGLIRGFVSAADAEAIVIPAGWPQIGGLTLATVLAGGSGCCASHSDIDTGPDGATPGWWFHLNFIAAPVPFHEPPAAVAPALTVAALSPGFPNPFNPSVTIPYHLPAPARVRVTVHDVTGALVAELAAGSMPAGGNVARWNGRDRRGNASPSGVYLVRLEAGAAILSRKIVLLK